MRELRWCVCVCVSILNKVVKEGLIKVIFVQELKRVRVSHEDNIQVKKF